MRNIHLSNCYNKEKRNEDKRMREKASIHRILSLLELIWQQQPDVRFNQLIANLQKLYSRQNNDYGKRKVTEKWDSGEVKSSYLDFFYLEDTVWESFLKSLIKNEKVDKKIAIWIMRLRWIHLSTPPFHTRGVPIFTSKKMMKKDCPW